jgi:hypothetical protein
MQFSSTIFEIAVGLMCVYIALSLLVSWINEMFAALFNLRGKGLSDGIAQMVSDAQMQASLFGHPIIASSVTNPKKLPSYMSATQFTTALLDVIGAGTTISTNASAAFTDVQNAVAALKPGALKTALTSILKTAAGDYGAVINGIQNWFNATMNGISGMYRRTSSIWIFFIGLALIGAIDADTLKVVTVLNCSSATRAALVASASASAKEADASVALQHVSTDVFNSLAFGWFGASPASPCGNSREPWWQVLLGIVATTLAISLGAPFWFDALKFLMNVRNAGANPSESKS